VKTLQALSPFTFTLLCPASLLFTSRSHFCALLLFCSLHVHTSVPCFSSVHFTFTLLCPASHLFTSRSHFCALLLIYSLAVRITNLLRACICHDTRTASWYADGLADVHHNFHLVCVIFHELIKSRRMRWAGHVARTGKRKVHTGFWRGYLREGDHLGDTGVDGRIILKWIFKKWDGWHGLDWAGSG
jgi:hypothetical protein